MNIRELTVGMVATCCYVLSKEDRDDCIVIDPGDEPGRIRKAADGRKIAFDKTVEIAVSPII